MHYTEEQFNQLAPYADEFRRAIESNYCHPPVSPELDKVRAAYMAATGTTVYPRDWGCTFCVMALMKDAGRLWLADAEARAAEKPANEAQAAQSKAQEPKTQKTSGKTGKAGKTAGKSKTNKTAKK